MKYSLNYKAMPSQNPSHRKARILVVEDELIVARDIVMQLGALGYEVVAQTGEAEQALALIPEAKPDLVLMDIQLAGAMDGIEAAGIVRAQFGIPVVFLSAFSAEAMLSRAKLSEPFGYILKPFSERELRTVLEMALYKSQADAAVRRAALRTQTILDHLVDGVITFDRAGVIGSFSEGACRLFQYTREEAVGLDVVRLLPPESGPAQNAFLAAAQAADTAGLAEPYREIVALRKDRTEFPVLLGVSPLPGEEAAAFIGIVRDITQQRKDNEEIRRLAFFDALTGLPNRRLLMDRARQAMLNSRRTGFRGALMLLDLDHFKQLNDTLGHDIGDVLLQQVAQRLETCLRETDSVARFGGDEFVILLENLDPQADQASMQAEVVAEKAIASLAAPFQLGNHTYNTTPSIGIVEFAREATTIDELMMKADVAMYQAKAAGRNAVRFFDPELQRSIDWRGKIERDMRYGLERQEFVLFYQVQVDGSGQPVGVEALVRWPLADGSMISPAQFIPVAESSGMILPLGRWVLHTACRQMVQWAASEHTAHLTMAVNVSALQFLQSDFVDTVQEALAQTGADPAMLKLELTESMLVRDIDSIIVKMNAIKALGVNFSLDDFGTGYSSLSYLKRLPLSQLKIDQSFVRDLMTDANDAVIARTIVALGRNLGLKVIAEGVEDNAQHSALAEMGCDAFQGYLFGRPAPADAISALQAGVIVSK